jgi:NAD(P)-dependent dehydrogenase (short-subunit alcohol dehydrogenase family)
MNRPETIEETAALVDEAGGRGIAVRVDHLVPDEVRSLVARIREEQGKLHVLVNDIWGATTMEWNKSVWESSLEIGLRTMRLAADTHAITSHFALPLLIETPGGLVVEVTDGTDEFNADNYRVSFFYDLAKAAVNRMAFALAHELAPRGATAVSLTPGWLRSEAMLDAYGVTESSWRDAAKRQPHFAISEGPAFVGRAVAALAQDPDVSRWNGKSLSSGQLGKVYGFTDLDGSQPDCWRYVVEVSRCGQARRRHRLPLSIGQSSTHRRSASAPCDGPGTRSSTSGRRDRARPPSGRAATLRARRQPAPAWACLPPPRGCLFD